MIFSLLCAGSLMIHGDARSVVVSGNNFYNYMRPGSIRLEVSSPRVYADDGQYQITIARDHKRVWVQLDVDDNPTDRGDELKCRILK